MFQPSRSLWYIKWTRKKPFKTTQGTNKQRWNSQVKAEIFNIIYFQVLKFKLNFKQSSLQTISGVLSTFNISSPHHLIISQHIDNFCITRICWIILIVFCIFLDDCLSQSSVTVAYQNGLNSSTYFVKTAYFYPCHVLVPEPELIRHYTVSVQWFKDSWWGLNRVFILAHLSGYQLRFCFHYFIKSSVLHYREKRKTTVDHYEAVYKGYKEKYEKFPLAIQRKQKEGELANWEENYSEAKLRAQETAKKLTWLETTASQKGYRQLILHQITPTSYYITCLFL